MLKKNWKKNSKNVENHQKNVKIQQKHQFSTFFYKFFRFFSTHFFGIFELRWQCSKFWLRWINFIFSKWLSYSHFTKSILPSFQVENVTAYHPSTISTSHMLDIKIIRPNWSRSLPSCRMLLLPQIYKLSSSHHPCYWCVLRGVSFISRYE